MLWQTTIGTDVAGDPVLVDGRLVNVGRGIGAQSSVVALDPQTGAAVWRFSGERFTASVVASSFLWYVSGSQTDSANVALYRIDVRSGERKPMANWRRPARVDQAWITYATGSVFVATTSPDLDKGTLQVGIDCFDAGSGVRQWQKVLDSKPSTLELQRPVALFTAQAGSLSYSTGQARWSVPLAAAPVKVATQHAVLWPPSSFQIQSDRLYAFTEDGHAYAMSQP